jgi:hypothetical protein
MKNNNLAAWLTEPLMPGFLTRAAKATSPAPSGDTAAASQYVSEILTNNFQPVVIASPRTERAADRLVGNKHLAGILRKRLSAISERTASIVAGLTDAQIVSDFLAHEAESAKRATVRVDAGRTKISRVKVVL